MNWFWKVVLIAAGIVVGREVYVALGPRRWRRRDLWQAAQERAQITGKPVLVIGDPDGGVVNAMFGRDYECGNLCVDLNACPRCANWLKGDLAQILPGLPSNSFTVYVSCTLEYVPKITEVLFHLDRISGGDLFIAHVEPTTLTAWFYPGAQQRLFTAPPRDPYVHFQRLPWVEQGRLEQHVLLPQTQRRMLEAVTPPAPPEEPPDVIDVEGEPI